MYSMALVSWELLSYVCCKNNEQQSRHDVSIWGRGLRHDVSIWGRGLRHDVSIWGRGLRHDVSIWGRGLRHDVSIWGWGLRGVGRYWVGDWGRGRGLYSFRGHRVVFRWELMLGPYLL